LLFGDTKRPVACHSPCFFVIVLFFCDPQLCYSYVIHNTSIAVYNTVYIQEYPLRHWVVEDWYPMLAQFNH